MTNFGTHVTIQMGMGDFTLPIVTRVGRSIDEVYCQSHNLAADKSPISVLHVSYGPVGLV